MVKNGHTSKNQNGTGTNRYKTLTNGDERDIRVKVIPMDYQRNRRIERDRERGPHFGATIFEEVMT